MRKTFDVVRAIIEPMSMTPQDLPSENSFDSADCRYDAEKQTIVDKVSGIVRDVARVCYPENKLELEKLIASANCDRVPYWVVSTGRNWGYGGTLPVENDARIFNLQRMNRILDFDRELGILHIEAGVTQGQLEHFLKDGGFEFCVPTTGAGPEASIIGNALERGFGTAPYEDHAGAILSINGFLADGTRYSSPLNEVDPLLAACFPSGVGPCLDRLAPQSSWLIVSDAKIQLARRPEYQEVIMVPFATADWYHVIEFLQCATRRADLPLGGYKILHREQINQSTRNAKWINRLATKEEWTLLFFLRCEKALAQPIRLEVRKLLKVGGLKAQIWGASKIRFLQKLIGFADRIIGTLSSASSIASAANLMPIQRALTDLSEFFRLGQGYTSEVGHRVRIPGDGLIWMSPLCPMSAAHVFRLLKVTRSWQKNSILTSNTWTWTVLNQRTLALVIPLGFSLETPQEEVWREYRDKLESLREAHFVPYRYPVECMSFVRESVAPEYFKIVDRFESALDPQNLLNAGRYS